MDITNGDTVCPNTVVKFTCVGEQIPSLSWLRNRDSIFAITPFITSGSYQEENFSVFVDAISMNETTQTINVTSRIVFTINDVLSQDVIACAENPNNQMSATLDYGRRSELQNGHSEYCLNITNVCSYIVISYDMRDTSYDMRVYRNR